MRTGGPSGIKIAGLAQRVTRRAARLEALILVEKTVELVPVLRNLYDALGLPFRAGSIGDLAGTDVPAAIEALSEAVRDRYPDAKKTQLADKTFERAQELRDGWRAGPGLSGSVSSSI